MSLTIFPVIEIFILFLAERYQPMSLRRYCWWAIDYKSMWLCPMRRNSDKVNIIFYISKAVLNRQLNITKIPLVSQTFEYMCWSFNLKLNYNMRRLKIPWHLCIQSFIQTTPNQPKFHYLWIKFQYSCQTISHFNYNEQSVRHHGTKKVLQQFLLQIVKLFKRTTAN